MDRTGKWSAVETSDEAVALVSNYFDQQLQVAEGLETAPNEPAPGDATAKSAFVNLLPPDAQRLVFLRHVKNRHFWPRIRTLVGVPPYGFLLPSDEGVLNAAGISRKRTRMVAETSVSVHYAISDGHFVDSKGRIYRVVSTNAQSSGGDAASRQLPWREIRSGIIALVDVKVRKSNNKDRAMSISAGRTDSLFLPRPQEKLYLQLTSNFASSSINNPVLDAVVITISQRAANSPVARATIRIL